MESKNNNRETAAHELRDDEPTNELTVLDVTTEEGSQPAVTSDDSQLDPNVLALRRVDAEIRRVMESWVDLEKQLKNRDIEIGRLRDHGLSVEEKERATRNELAASRSDCERLRVEAADQRTRAEKEYVLHQEDRQKAQALQLELAAAGGRIHELESQIHQGKMGRDRLETQLGEHRDALAGMAAELRKFEKAGNSHDSEKAALAARIADLERRSTELTGQWREAAAAARQTGEQLQAESRRAEGLESELWRARQAASELEKAVEEKIAVTTRLGEAQRELAVERDNGLALRKQLKTGEHAVAQAEGAVAQAEGALEQQRQKTEAALNTASRAEQLLAETRTRLSALAEVEATVDRLGAALAAAEAAAVTAAGDRESLLATIAGLRERVSVLDAERAQLIEQLDEQRAHFSAIDLEFQAKRRSIDALSTEFNRLGHIQANVRKLDNMVSRQLSGGSETDGEADRPLNGRLIVSLDGEKVLKYPLFKPDMVIGRSRDTDIRIAGRHTSRRHARVFVDGGAVMIEDLGSLNGITVNNKKVRKHALHDGDVLDVGGARLRFVDLNEKPTAH